MTRLALAAYGGFFGVSGLMTAAGEAEADSPISVASAREPIPSAPLLRRNCRRVRNCALCSEGSLVIEPPHRGMGYQPMSSGEHGLVAHATKSSFRQSFVEIQKNI